MSEARSTVEVGRLLRGQARRLIRSTAHTLRLKLTLEEEKGWFESVFLLHYSGEPSAVAAFATWLGRVFNDP